MPGLIRQSDIDEVRARTNIADIIGEHVTLKSAGVGSLKGLCPFHEERSPSFHVRPQLGVYHCFGCGEGGNVYTFLQRMDHLTFREAVERLAGRLSFELRYEDGGAANPEHGSRARLLAANAAAEAWFRAQLGTPEARLGREFLGARGFDQAAAERFGVGFAPRSFDALSGALTAQGFSKDELVGAGLLSTNDRGSSYDRFRGRLIWPIRDVTGQTVGFGARKLLGDDEDRGPKYLNTPETPVFHKSQVLYGLDLARRDVARGKQVVVVEGYTDVMACHLAGVTTAVATCGTSFGVEHIKVIRRVLGDTDGAAIGQAGEVVFTFDPDEAGQKAATRAFAEEQRFAAQTFVAVAPDGLDPCDLRLNRGDAAVRRLVEGRRPMFEFMIRRTLAGHDLETVEGRVSALRAAAPVLGGIRDRSLSDGYVRTLAGWLGMDQAEVGRAVRAARQRESPRDVVGRSTGTASSAPTGLVSDAPPPPLGLADLPADPSTRLEVEALVAALQQPAMVGEELLGRLARSGFHTHALSVVRDAIGAHLGEPAQGWSERVAAAVPESYASLVRQLEVAPLRTRADRLAAYCRGIVSQVVERDILRRKAEVRGALQRAGAEGDTGRVAELNRQAVEIEQERRRLRGE